MTGRSEICDKVVMPMTVRPNNTFAMPMLLRIAQLYSKYVGSVADDIFEYNNQVVGTQPVTLQMNIPGILIRHICTGLHIYGMEHRGKFLKAYSAAKSPY